MKRIAIFLPKFSAGGAERVMLTLARSFYMLYGVEVDLVVNKYSGPLVTDIPESCNVFELKCRRMALCVPAFSRYLKRRRPDVVLATLMGPIIVGYFGAHLAGCKTRFIARQANSDAYLAEALRSQGKWLGNVGQMVLRHCLRRADAVIAVSDDVCRDLRRMKVSPRLVYTISNPIDISWVIAKSHENISNEWLSKSRCYPVLVAAGRLVPQKGFAELLKAIAILKRDVAVRCIILGEGPLRGELVDFANSLGIAERVSLPGAVKNPYPFFKNADLFVSSSRWEGMPNVLLEAFACGAPVVATNCPGGTSEIMSAINGGLLVEKNNPRALADGIKKIMASEKAELDIQRALAEKFGIENITGKYFDVLFR